jgi:hypothetical protein
MFNKRVHSVKNKIQITSELSLAKLPDLTLNFLIIIFIF